MSPTDLVHFSKDQRVQSKAVLEAVTVLCKQKPLFDRIVSGLLDNECLAEDDVIQLANQFLVGNPRRKLRKSAKK